MDRWPGVSLVRNIDSLGTLADTRLRRRCVVAATAKPYEERYATFLAELSKANWEIRHRQASGARPISLLIIDGSIFAKSVSGGPLKPENFEFGVSEKRDYAIRHLFDHLWSSSSVVGGPNPGALYEDRGLALPDSERRVIEVSKESWDDIISRLASFPQEVLELTPRKFEELVAELLIKEGLDVILTPASGDGGRDVLAYNNTIAGKHLYLVECKRYSPERPVGVGLVRQLYGVLELERATAGMLVTTSNFTKGAREFRDSIEYRIDLKDYAALARWLRRIKP